jgi:hypothetical protein
MKPVRLLYPEVTFSEEYKMGFKDGKAETKKWIKGLIDNFKFEEHITSNMDYPHDFIDPVVIKRELKKQIHGHDGCNGSKSKSAISPSKKQISGAEE